jgi:hypothetical protein
MSDYLWDKTGEPEADVQELENLLGTLKYKPRPLEIPADAMPHAAAATRPAMVFSRPRLAIAASLLLTLLAGAWFITRQGEPQKNGIATVNNGSETGTSGQREKTVAGNDKIAGSAPGDDNKVDKVVAPKPRETRAGIVRARSLKVQRAPRGLFASNAPGRRRSEQPSNSQQRDATRTVRSVFTHDHAPSTSQQQVSVAANGGMRWQVEEPLTPQQREATEQLMLALSVASAKFNYAQREMQEIGRAGNR